MPYKIRVEENYVEISGDLTIRQAFDFLSFYEREGYTELSNAPGNACLFMTKKTESDEPCEKDEYVDWLHQETKELRENIQHHLATIRSLEELIKKLMQKEKNNGLAETN